MVECRKKRGEIGYELTEADLVWNRACTRESKTPMIGDVALSALLRFHNLAMNGGVLHALECLTPQELEAAISGYRFFGFDNVGDLLIEARLATETSDEDELDLLEAKLDNLYGDLIPTDSTLDDRFEVHFRGNPTHFAPLVHESVPEGAVPPHDIG